MACPAFDDVKAAGRLALARGSILAHDDEHGNECREQEQ
jgi:hypothetical protein